MKKLFRISNNPLESTFNDLKMFEQTQYCYEYIKKENPNVPDEEIIKHADISSACFQQASEYYKAGVNSSLNTNPLLFSYAMNNILKGLAYLKTFDTGILDGFNKHGFSVKPVDISDNILESLITIEKNGAVKSLLKIYNSSLENQKIDFNKLLRHIPNIEKTYFQTTGVISLSAIKDKNDISRYFIPGNNINDEIKNIMNKISMSGNITDKEEICICCPTMAFKQNIDNGIYNKNNIYYRDYMVIPDTFNEGIKDINVAFYCYLLIMSYGMLVRYNAHIWQKYIDKKNSKNAILIELSIPNAIENFYYQIHYMLFGYYYEDNTYNDLDVKKVIDSSTRRIMNNISKKVKERNYRTNGDDICPWSDSYR